MHYLTAEEGRGKRPHDEYDSHKGPTVPSPKPDGAGIGGGARAGLQPAQSSLSMKDFGENVKKLPLYVGQKMMDMVHHLNENLRENMSNTVYGQNPLVWEMFCSKDSALAEACMREGIPVERINLAQGFDLYKPETYTTLLHLFRQQRPKKVWISTMCTLFCSWVDLNYHDRREVLDKRRRRERKMFRLLTAFLLQVLTEFPDTDLF